MKSLPGTGVTLAASVSRGRRRQAAAGSRPEPDRCPGTRRRRSARTLPAGGCRTCGVGREQIARARQQIGEVERAGRLLERLISLGRARQLLLQRGGEVGVGVLPELLKIGEQRVARGEHLGAGHRIRRTCSRCPCGSARSRGRARDRPGALPSRRDRGCRTTARGGSGGSDGAPRPCR